MISWPRLGVVGVLAFVVGHLGGLASSVASGGDFGGSSPPEIGIDGGDTRWVNVIGDTMSGALTVTGATNANGGIVAQAGNLTLASPDGGVIVTGRVDITGVLVADSQAVNTIRKNDAFGSSVSTSMWLEHGINAGVGAAGAGVVQTFRTEDSGGVMDDIAGIGGSWTVATAGSETGQLIFWIKSAGTYAERATMSPTVLTIPGLKVTGTSDLQNTLSNTSANLGGAVYVGDAFTTTGATSFTSTTSSGTCTLDGASPSVCTATTFAGADCVCSSVGATAAIAAQGCAVNLVTTTLTITSANGATNVVNYHCF